MKEELAEFLLINAEIREFGMATVFGSKRLTTAEMTTLFPAQSLDQERKGESLELTAIN